MLAFLLNILQLSSLNIPLISSTKLISLISHSNINCCVKNNESMNKPMSYMLQYFESFPCSYKKPREYFDLPLKKS